MCEHGHAHGRRYRHAVSLRGTRQRVYVVVVSMDALTGEKVVAMSSWVFVLLALALGIWLGNNKAYLLGKCRRGPRKTCDFDRATSTMPALVHKSSGSEGKLVPEPTV